jgi:hypothetical protein
VKIMKVIVHVVFTQMRSNTIKKTCSRKFIKKYLQILTPENTSVPIEVLRVLRVLRKKDALLQNCNHLLYYMSPTPREKRIYILSPREDILFNRYLPSHGYMPLGSVWAT